jgi:hypothetical protein
MMLAWNNITADVAGEGAMELCMQSLRCHQQVSKVRFSRSGANHMPPRRDAQVRTPSDGG